MVFESCKVIDLDHGYYCVRFTQTRDYEFVFNGGTWLIADHYLPIRRWTPYFRSHEATIDKVTAWIRFPSMPIEFYDREILRTMAEKIGRFVNVDKTTTDVSRGKFARLSVEIDLSKPLVPYIYIGNRWQRVEYEGLRMMCFECGRFGHDAENCKEKEQEKDEAVEAHADAQSSQNQQADNERGKNYGFGPWMVVKKPPRKTPANKQVNEKEKATATSKTQAGSRFTVLDNMEDSQDSDEIVPNTFETNVIVTANRNDDGKRVIKG